MKIKISRIAAGLVAVFVLGLSLGYPPSKVKSPLQIDLLSVHPPVTAGVGYPIAIQGDTGWAAFRLAGNCTGGGVEGDPYIIADLVIDAGGTNSCIFINGSTAYFRVENCSLRNAAAGWAAGIMLRNVTHGVLASNNVSSNPTGIVLMQRSTNCEVLGNNVSLNAYGIVLDTNSSNNVVSTNQVAQNDMGIVIQVNSSSNTITANNVSQNNIDGITILQNCSGNGLWQNNVTDNGCKGIYLSQGSGNTTLQGNEATWNGDCGIWLNFWSNNNTIRGNNASTNGVDGVQIAGHSANNTIELNIVLNNTGRGLMLADGAMNNTFIRNYVVNNTGIGADASMTCDGNWFWGNNFSTNVAGNAQDDGAYNHWDNGSMGNFWSDYGGLDENDDGIGDDPQPVAGSGGVQDNFPVWEDADEQPPVITINAPLTFSLANATAPVLNVTCTDQSLDASWYTIGEDSTRFFFAASYVGQMDMATWGAQPNGIVSITVYANDTSGQLASKSVVIHKDIAPPVINIIEPKNGSTFFAEPPAYNVTVTDANIDTVWVVIIAQGIEYVIPDSGASGTIPADVWAQIPMGVHIVRIFANDTLGNIAYVDVSITKMWGSGIPGFPLEVFGFYVLLGIGIILCKRREKSQNTFQLINHSMFGESEAY